VERWLLSGEHIIHQSKEVGLVFRGKVPEAKMNISKSTAGRAQ